MTAPGSLLKSAAAGCEPFSAFPLLPGPPTRTPAASVTGATSRCELVPAFPLLPEHQPAPHGPLRHPPLPGMSRFRRIGSHLRRVTQAPGPVLWQRAHGNRRPPAQHKSIAGGRPLPVRRPAGHLRCALSLKTSPTLSEPRPGQRSPGRDCRCEFRQARSRAPLPDSVMAVADMTDGVWQDGSVTRTLRRGPYRASRHDRGRRKTPRAPRLTLSTNPRSCPLSPERHLPSMVLCGTFPCQV